MSGVLVFGTMDGSSLAKSSLEAAAAGSALAAAMQVPLTGALIGRGLDNAAKQFACGGMNEVLVVDHATCAPYANEIHIAAGEEILRRCSPSVVLFPHNAETRDWAPRLAARARAPMVTDAISVTLDGDDLLIRKPVYGGSIIAEYVAVQRPFFATITECTYEPAQRGVAEITPLPAPGSPARITVVDEAQEQSGAGPRLKDARIVVAGGVGVGSKENWWIIKEAAAALGAAVGASRAVADLGWVGSSQQVGFSGVRVSPDLYIAVGISGAVHHLAGISRAKLVVAVNCDPDANIFRVARYGAVGDAMAIVPAFIERARELRAKCV